MPSGGGPAGAVELQPRNSRTISATQLAPTIRNSLIRARGIEKVERPLYSSSQPECPLFRPRRPPAATGQHSFAAPRHWLKLLSRRVAIQLAPAFYASPGAVMPKD